MDKQDILRKRLQCLNNWHFDLSSTGTFYNRTGLQNETGCLPCSAGYYCDGTGNIVPSKKCHEGFWCRGGSSEEQPLNQPYGTECPNGSYCPRGTPSPVLCPKGTYQPSQRNTRVEDCVDCDPGKFCSETGLSAVSGDCKAGYFCKNKADKSNPEDGVTGDICPVGSFCVEGSIQPHTCYNGTYMNHTGNSCCLMWLTTVLNVKLLVELALQVFLLIVRFVFVLYIRPGSH